MLLKLINQEIAEYIAMRWFGKGKHSEVWDDAVPEVINDLEAAQRIRRICEAAADIAKSVGSRTGGSAEKERYERAARTAMQIALRISDDLVRDAALRQIIDLSVKANRAARYERVTLFSKSVTSLVRGAARGKQPAIAAAARR